MSAPRGGHPSDRSLGVEPRVTLGVDPSTKKDATALVVTRGDRVLIVSDPSAIPLPTLARLMGGR